MRRRTPYLGARPCGMVLIAAALILFGGADILAIHAQAIGSAPAQASVVVTLPEAIRRAEANEPNFAAIGAEQKAASLDRSIARAALLPNIIYHNQFLYTQPNGVRDVLGTPNFQPAPVFVANNGVHEYTSQAAVTETFGLAQVFAVRAADAVAARATADLEIARRGLRAATTGLFYGVASSERRLIVLQTAKNEAAQFVSLTQLRETAREAAHADVVKAELTLQQRTRDLTDAALARDRAHLELAVLLFADPLTPFRVELPAAPVLPALADVQAAARAHNPELGSALASLRLGDAEVSIAKAAYLPDLVLNFNYGIDALQFAKNGRLGLDPSVTGSQAAAGTAQQPRNLGYSAAATLDIPVWDWFSTQRRVKQSEVRRDAVRVALTAAQRRLVVNLQEGYTEAQTAQNQLASLETTVRTAEESLRLTKLRYTNGEATALEVVDAQTTLYSVQVAQEDGQVRYEQALSSLQVLTGTL